MTAPEAAPARGPLRYAPLIAGPSGLTGRYYLLTRYYQHEDGLIENVGEKHDVTEQVLAIVGHALPPCEHCTEDTHAPVDHCERRDSLARAVGRDRWRP